jgi:uncharacterized protein YlzI (FlbEa/FlbD family)
MMFNVIEHGTGRYVWVNSDHVLLIRPEHSRTEIVLAGGYSQWVTETVDEVISRIESATGWILVKQ